MSDTTPDPGAPDADRELTTSRMIDASPGVVFEAFRDPDRLAQWWGPEGFTNTFEEFDLRPNGRWCFVMHSPDGRRFENESLFVEIVAPERVVFQHVSAPLFEMTITFDVRGDRTLVGWRQRFDTAAERDRIARFAAAANEQNLDRLAAYVRSFIEGVPS